jgi:hypothetical protein
VRWLPPAYINPLFYFPLLFSNNLQHTIKGAKDSRDDDLAAAKGRIELRLKNLEEQQLDPEVHRILDS